MRALTSVVAEAEARGHAGAERLDQHVGVIAKPQQRIASCGILQVEHTLFLPRFRLRKNTLVRSSIGGDVASRIAFAGRLDLDHLGAVIGERHA